MCVTSCYCSDKKIDSAKGVKETDHSKITLWLYRCRQIAKLMESLDNVCTQQSVIKIYLNILRSAVKSPLSTVK